MSVVQCTQPYVEGSVDRDGEMMLGWQEMVAHTVSIWAQICGELVFIVEEDEDEEWPEMEDNDQQEWIGGLDGIGDSWV